MTQRTHDRVGKIHSVSCKSFITYDEVEMFPGDYLNLIIGPNGTGKSTLVAAIVLGLGGPPKIMSRSSKITDFIKNGMESASVCVKIVKNSKEHTIAFERSFDSTAKSTWKIDNKIVTQKDYMAGVAKFNIQIENLCQFLPQDKVQDFAKMTPQELLESTINSVCESDVMEKLEKLKLLRNSQITSNKDLTTNAEKLKEEEQKVAELKEQIDKMETRVKYEKRIDIGLSKQAWIKYNEMKARLNSLESDMKQAEAILTRDEKTLSEVTSKSKHIVKSCNQFENMIKTEAENGKRLAEQLSKLNGQCDALEGKIRDGKTELQEKHLEQAERCDVLVNESKVLEMYVQDLKNAVEELGPEDQRVKGMGEFEKKLEANKTEHRKLMDKHRIIDRQLGESFNPELAILKRKINAIENVDQRKMAMLSDRFPDVHKGVLWLRQNRHIFQDEIYEPMILMLNMKDVKNAIFIENSVSLRDLLAFTCVNKSDMNLLVQKLCTEQRLKVNTVHSQPSDNLRYESDVPIRDMRKYGFQSYAIDLIDGPAPILNYLCEVHHLHSTLIGNDTVYEKLDNLPHHVRRFFTPSHKFSITISRYSKDPSTMQENINSKNLLQMNIDQNELLQLKQKLNEVARRSDRLKNERTEIENLVSQNEKQRNDILVEKKEMEVKYNAMRTCKENVRRQQEKYKKIESQSFDMEAEEEKFKKFAEETVTKLITLHQTKISVLNEYSESIQKHDYEYTKLNIYRRENSLIENELKAAQEKYTDSKRMVENVNHQVENHSSKCEEKLDFIRNKSNGKIPTDRKFPSQNVFNSMPNELDALEEVLNELQSRVDCMRANDQSIIDEHNRRVQTMEELKCLVNMATNSSDDLETKMAELHEMWFKTVTDIIEHINSNFTRLMASMSYVGEVQLMQGNSPRDYEDYGIKIMVKYRENEKLQALDRSVQSGGERAVAIAVYTLSMQRITNVPFRCVDEINQGMDSRNERKIFEMIVQEISQPGQSQYFFVTPKLLLNLSYNDYMTVHIIYNGFIDNHEVFNKF